jgi:spore germination protein GerM
MVVVVLTLAGCSPTATPDQQVTVTYNAQPYDSGTPQNVLTVYGWVDNRGRLVPFSLPADGKSSALNQVVEILFGPPEMQGLATVIPSGSPLPQVSVRDGNAEILVDRSLANIITRSETARKALVLTLTEFDDINTVTVTLEGGAAVIDQVLERPVVYYPTDPGLGKVYVVMPAVRPGSPDMVFQQLAACMIPGLKEPGGRVTAMGNGLVAVNLERRFLVSLLATGVGEEQTVESITLTLTELPGVTAVQFLVDGRSLGSLRGEVDISRPIRRSRANPLH